MAKYPSKGESLWNDTVGPGLRRTYSTLKEDIAVDVAIIGAGIAGLTLAYLLKRRGKRVAVLEKATIGEGVSGFTTAKVTAQHGLIYTELDKKFGADTARIYGEANQEALRTIETIIKTEKIDCDWRRDDNYVYTSKVEEVEDLKQEAQLARSLGLPADFLTDLPLEVDALAAVRFKNQATFHIVKYLQGLAGLIDGDGSYVFEHSKAFAIKDETPARLKTKQATVTADDIVFATNAPSTLKDHIAYGLYEYPVRSYIVAGEASATSPKKGMYISTGKPTHSILPTEVNGRQWLLVGGYGHFVGMSGPAAGRYKKLEAVAQQLGVKSVRYRWSTWDFVSYDGLPLIGHLYKNSTHVYVATGFRKWGMTNATVAGLLLADTLTGVVSPWVETFRPYRPSLIKSLPKGIIKAVGFNK